MSKPQQKAQQLAKFLAYVLSRQPDEFGLVADVDGFVTVKSLLQALNEEKGWRHIRKKDIEGLFWMLPEVPLELDGNRIRSIIRTHLPTPQVKMNLPKLLYTCVRRRAWPVIATRGLEAGDPANAPIVLAADQKMALLRGRRIDTDPVLLTIHTATAQEMGALFKQYGKTLFLTTYIPTDGISGPPLPKDELQRKKVKKKTRPQTPGSFTLKPKTQPDHQDDPPTDPPSRSKSQRRRKEQKWQREKPPWRR